MLLSGLPSVPCDHRSVTLRGLRNAGGIILGRFRERTRGSATRRRLEARTVRGKRNVRLFGWCAHTLQFNRASKLTQVVEDDKKKYHVEGLRAELVRIQEMEETHPGHFEVQGVIKVHGQRSYSAFMPVVACNKMAEAMVKNMRTGCEYLFNGFLSGGDTPEEPSMRLQVCWTDRVLKFDPALN